MKLFAAFRVYLSFACLVAGSTPLLAQDLFVSSIFSNQVFRFDRVTGANKGVFASGMNGPYGIDFGPDGNLYVGSLFGPKLITKHSGQTGALLGTFVNLAALDSVDIPFRPAALYVVIGGVSGRIVRYNRHTGALLGTFTPPINEPVGMAWNAAGDLFVSSFAQNSVFRFNGVTGQLIGTFAIAGLSNPYGIRFGPDGNLYVANIGTDVVTRYDGSTGSFMGTFASGGGLDDPTGILFGKDGNLYVASGNTNQVLRFNGKTGAFMGVFATGSLSGPVFMAFRPPVLIAPRPH